MSITNLLLVLNFYSAGMFVKFNTKISCVYFRFLNMEMTAIFGISTTIAKYILNSFDHPKKKTDQEDSAGGLK